jgi:hypothetical protein
MRTDTDYIQAILEVTPIVDQDAFDEYFTSENAKSVLVRSQHEENASQRRLVQLMQNAVAQRQSKVPVR